MDVCTIIAKNYLPAARVLAASLAEHHPDVTLHVLVIDEWEGWIDPAQERFELVDRTAIGVPDVDQMASIYTVLEFSTAVKPWLLRHLLEREGATGIVYLDPDTRLYAPIDDVFAAVEEHGLVLNPHNSVPMPRDGRKPSEQDILIAGVYNLGFIGLGRTEFSAFLLDWWGERLKSDCIVDPERGFFVDQRWMDLVPALADDMHLVRDPGFNVAYWNLGAREVGEREDGTVLIDGRPLRLFHFSGFRANKPHELSTHQDRILLSDHPPLARLCTDYAGELMAAGYEDASRWSYSWNVTSSGVPLDRVLRLVYRDALEDGHFDGSLFDHAGEQEFLDWCNAPALVGGRHGVTRFLMEYYDKRRDLQVVYPDLDDPADAEGYLGWARVFGSHEVPIPDALLPAPRAVEPAVAAGNGRKPVAERRPLPRPLAVNVAGYLRSELGVGEVARQAIAALDANGVPLMPTGLHAPNSRAGHGFTAAGQILAPFEINLVCVNADGLPAFAKQVGPAFFEGRYTIGVWWWELSAFPASLGDAFEHVDEIWAGSRFVADAVSAAAPVPVLTMPLPLTPPPPTEPDRARFDLPADAFAFLFAFDYNSVFKRKNPLGTVEAFRRAFGDDADVQLVVKCINHERDAAGHEELRHAIAGLPNVRLIEGYLSAADNIRLTASCDAFVSLHRSEGFGLGLAEALMLGKPVVATNYGGNTDFIDEATGFPVAYDLVPVGDDAWPYPRDGIWADPDLNDAARQLRRVVEDPRHARALAARGADRLRTVHSPAAAGARMARRLGIVHGKQLNRAAATPLALTALPEPPDELLRKIAKGPVAPERSAIGPAGRLARRLALRLMKPYTAHASAIQADLARELGEYNKALRHSVATLEVESALVEAEQLAETRRLNAAWRASASAAD